MIKKPILIYDELGVGSVVVNKLAEANPVLYCGSASELKSNKRVGTVKGWSHGEAEFIIVLSGKLSGESKFMDQQGVKVLGAYADADKIDDAGYLAQFCKKADLDYSKVSKLGMQCAVGGMFNGQRFIAPWVSFEHRGLMDGDVGPITEGMGSLLIMPSASIPFIRYLQKTAEILNKAHYLGPFNIACCVNDEGYWVESINPGFVQPSFNVWASLLYEPLGMALNNIVKGESHLEAKEDVWALGVCLAKSGYPHKVAYQGVKNMIQGLVEAAGDNCQVLLDSVFMEKEACFTGSLGRVLTLLGQGATIVLARDDAYRALDYVGFDDMMYRLDLGERARLNQMKLCKLGVLPESVIGV